MEGEELNPGVSKTLGDIGRFFEVKKHFQAALKNGLESFTIELLAAFEINTAETLKYEFITSMPDGRVKELTVYLDISQSEFQRYWRQGTKKDLLTLIPPVLEAFGAEDKKSDLDKTATRYVLNFICQ